MRLTNEYNLSTQRPDLDKEWHPTKNGDRKSTDVTPGSGDKVWWICKKGDSWKAEIKSRSRGNGCPKCYNRKRGGVVPTNRGKSCISENS